MDKKIVCILGFTGSGKNTILDKIMEFAGRYNDLKSKIGRLVYHTTRNKRENEVEGVDYYFDEYTEFGDLYLKYGYTLIEHREYFTLNDDKIFYYTLEDDIEKSKYDILVVTASPNQYKAYKARYGDNVIGVFIESSIRTRMLRVLNTRYKTDKDCCELCRRILDELDEFTEVFENDDAVSSITKFTNDEDTDIEVLYKSVIRQIIRPLIEQE